MSHADLPAVGCEMLTMWSPQANMPGAGHRCPSLRGQRRAGGAGQAPHDEIVRVANQVLKERVRQRAVEGHRDPVPLVEVIAGGDGRPGLPQRLPLQRIDLQRDGRGRRSAERIAYILPPTLNTRASGPKGCPRPHRASRAAARGGTCRYGSSIWLPLLSAAVCCAPARAARPCCTCRSVHSEACVKARVACGVCAVLRAVPRCRGRCPWAASRCTDRSSPVASATAARGGAGCVR